MKHVGALIGRFAICSLFFLFACSSDDPVAPSIPDDPIDKPGDPVPNPPDETKTCVITSFDYSSLSYAITRTEAGVPLTVSYTKYAGNAIDQSSTFVHDAEQKLVRIENKIVSMNYSYDDFGRIVSERIQPLAIPEPPYLREVEYVFTYDDKGNLDTAYYSPQQYERFEHDDNGNVIKKYIKYDGQAEYLAQEYLAFDTGKNPFYEYPFSSNVMLNHIGVTSVVTSFNPLIHKNNVTETKIYQPDGTSRLVSVTYDYNDLDYPISSSYMVAYGYQCE